MCHLLYFSSFGWFSDKCVPGEREASGKTFSVRMCELQISLCMRTGPTWTSVYTQFIDPALASSRRCLRLELPKIRALFDWVSKKPKPKLSQRPIKTKRNIPRRQWKLKANTSKRRQARENASDQVAIGFSFASDWLKKWREISKPITECSTPKPMQSRITFDTQLIIAL